MANKVVAHPLAGRMKVRQLRYLTDDVYRVKDSGITGAIQFISIPVTWSE